MFYKKQLGNYSNFFLFEPTEDQGSTEIATLRIGVGSRQTSFAMDRQVIEDLIEYLQILIEDECQE